LQNQKNIGLPKETLKIFEFYTIIKYGTKSSILSTRPCAFQAKFQGLEKKIMVY